MCLSQYKVVQRNLDLRKILVTPKKRCLCRGGVGPKILKCASSGINEFHTLFGDSIISNGRKTQIVPIFICIFPKTKYILAN